MKNRKYCYFVVQPERKKREGLALERLGVWYPRGTVKTVPRQISLNIHRAKYWLSVGAEPSRKVHRLFSKFGILPNLPPKYGQVHHYDKPEKEPHRTYYRALGRKRDHAHNHGHILKFKYRQKLQEELNLVERRRLLAAGLLNHQGGRC